MWCYIHLKRWWKWKKKNEKNQPSSSEHNCKSFTTSRTTIHLTSATAHLRVYVLLKRLPLLFSSIHSILSERSHTADYSSSILKAHIPPLSSLSLYSLLHTHSSGSQWSSCHLSMTHSQTQKVFSHVSLCWNMFSCSLAAGYNEYTVSKHTQTAYIILQEIMVLKIQKEQRANMTSAFPPLWHSNTIHT